MGTNRIVASQRVRPFGPLRWILGKLKSSSSDAWSVIGALSPEDRCLAAAQEIGKLTSRTDWTLLRIKPEERSTDTRRAEAQRKAVENLSKAKSGRLKPILVDVGTLLSEEHRILNLAEDLANGCHSNVALDITTMPKRFFFPILTALRKNERIKCLIATNTAPLRYGEKLADGADDWTTLPSFDGDILNEPEETTLMIAVGFDPLNVKDLLERKRSRRVAMKLLFPFPSLHPGFIPNWRFVNHIKSEWGDIKQTAQASRIEIVRVPTHDVSTVFDRLLQHSNAGKAEGLTLAPFGPKSISLAMCLLGNARMDIGRATEIGYTQPSIYMPDYTTGVADCNGVPNVVAYCIRLKGRDLFTLAE